MTCMVRGEGEEEEGKMRECGRKQVRIMESQRSPGGEV